MHALDLAGVPLWAFLNKRLAGWVNLTLNRRGKHPIELAEALIDDVNAESPDAVIVTGDLTNLSLPSEFARARALLDRLALGPEQVMVVPGNHDVYTLSAKWQKLFARALAPYVTGDRGPDFPTVRVRGEVALLGVSTARPSPVPFADGAIGGAQLEALEAELERQRGKFRVLAMHHPPVVNRHVFLRGLRDRAALQQVLRRVGCELIVHGHEHRDVRAELPGPNGAIPVIGVGSATYASEKPDRRARYNIYRIENGRLISVETRVHDPSRHRFLAAA